jgi:hypothetical protein
MAAAVDCETEPGDEAIDFVVEFGGLIFDRPDDNDERPGKEEGLPEGAHGGDDGLAPLPAGEQEQTAMVAIENGGLDGIRGEAEGLRRPRCAGRHGNGRAGGGANGPIGGAPIAMAGIRALQGDGGWLR